MDAQNKVKRSELLKRIEALEAKVGELTLLHLTLRKLVKYEATKGDPLAQHPSLNQSYLEVVGKWLEQDKS